MSDLEDILNQKIKQLDDELGSLDISIMGQGIDNQAPDLTSDKKLTKPELIDLLMYLQDFMPDGYVTKMHTEYRRMKVGDLQIMYDNMKKTLPPDFDKKQQNEDVDALSSYYSSDDPIVINTNSNLDFIVPEIVDTTTTTTTTMPVLLDTTTTTTTVLPNNDVVVHNITSDHKSSGKTIEIKVGNDVTISIRV
jgi:hypothetical protein